MQKLPLITHYEDIGFYLRDCRESLRLQISDVVRATHIRPKYLEAMERGDFSILPGGIYIRGYVQAYAEFLGVDKNDIVQRLKGTEARNRQSLTLPNSPRPEIMPKSAIMLTSTIVVCALLYTWIFGIKQEDSPLPAVSPLPSELQMLLNTPRFRTESPVQCLLRRGSYTFPFCGDEPFPVELSLTPRPPIFLAYE